MTVVVLGLERLFVIVIEATITDKIEPTKATPFCRFENCFFTLPLFIVGNSFESEFFLFTLESFGSDNFTPPFVTYLIVVHF